MTFVTRIYTDRRVGVRNDGRSVSGPSLNQVLDAVRRLDGEQFTELLLSGEKRNLTISGGNEGRYIAFISVNGDEAFYNLTNAEGNPKLELKVVTGGQVGSYSSRQVVPLSSVLTAARDFYESGQASTLLWEKQS